MKRLAVDPSCLSVGYVCACVRACTCVCVCARVCVCACVRVCVRNSKELQKLTQRRDEQRAMKAAEEQEDTAKGRGAFNGNRAQLSEREKRAEKEGRKKQRAQRKRERKATHRECRAARAKVKALQDLSPFMKVCVRSHCSDTLSHNPAAW